MLLKAYSQIGTELHQINDGLFSTKILWQIDLICTFSLFHNLHFQSSSNNYLHSS